MSGETDPSGRLLNVGEMQHPSKFAVMKNRLMKVVFGCREEGLDVFFTTFLQLNLRNFNFIRVKSFRVSLHSAGC